MTSVNPGFHLPHFHRLGTAWSQFRATRALSGSARCLPQSIRLVKSHHNWAYKARSIPLHAGANGIQAYQVIEASTLLQKLNQKYEAVLLDQFGVLHDGRTPYDGAVNAVRRLHAAGLRVLIISNSSRRSSGTLGRLANMGFEEHWFAGAITSGELTYLHLLQRPDAWWQNLGQRCLHLTWSSRGRIPLDGLSLQVVSDPADADFILAHGTQGLGRQDGGVDELTLGEINKLLERCIAQGLDSVTAGSSSRRLPMIVANPDMVTVDGKAGLVVMPGTLAATYTELGGQVILMGKPAPAIYQSALDMLGLEHSKVLAIGDSLQHDIAGARQSGIDTLFIAGGIHAGELQVGFQEATQATIPAAAAAAAAANSAIKPTWDQNVLAELCREHGVVPTFVMTYLECCDVQGYEIPGALRLAGYSSNQPQHRADNRQMAN